MEEFLNSLEPAHAKFCEARVDGIPRYPANTYSNLAPLIAGIIIIYLARHRSRGLKMLGWATAYTGIASGLFHATDTFIGEVLDLSGMYLFILSCLSLQLGRIEALPRSRVVLFSLGSCVLFTAISIMFIYAAVPLFAAVVAAVIILELRSKHVTSFKWAYASFAVLGVSLIFWLLDYFHIMCNPHNHYINGHALWHILSAFTFFFAYLHFAENSKGKANLAEARP